MTEERDEFGRQVADRLRAHEARVPVSGEPALATPSSSLLRLAVAAGSVVVVASVAVVALMLQTAPPPTGDASATPSLSPTEPIATVMPSPTSVATPLATAIATPSPTLAPRQAWALYPVIGDAPDARLQGVVELRGRLYAFGSNAGRAAIWVSEDGINWSGTDVPAPPRDYSARVWDIVDAGDQLVAVAPGGAAEGSGIFTTSIYVSADGSTWRLADSTPPFDSGAHYALARTGARILAIGVSVWVSPDSGMTWVEEENFEGAAFDAVSHGEMVVAAGQASGGDISDPPAYAWISSDRGRSWVRTEIDSRGIARAVAVGTDGRIVATGTADPDSTSTAWTSTDGGATWTRKGLFECCAGAVVATPTGFVFFSGYAAAPTIATSDDGLNWTLDPLEFEATGASWGPTFGLVGSAADAVGLGPHPIP